MDTAYTQSFIQILEQNKQKLFRICRVYAKRREDQEDLFGEVVFHIWKSLPTFKNDCHINTWLYRITLNVCMRYAIKLDKIYKYNKPLDGIQITFPDANAQQHMEQEEKISKLYTCIATLTESEKSVILLFLEDLPYKEIALITGLSENNIAQKISRIKKKLFTCLTH